MDELTEAINAVDLPALISELYPESKAKPGKQDLVHAVWKPTGDEKASFSLYRSKQGNIWMFRDHATEQGGNSFHFLVDVIGMDKQAAAEMIMKRVGASPTPTRSRATKPNSRREVPEETSTGDTCQSTPVPVATLKKLKSGMNEALVANLIERGFTEEDRKVYRFAAKGQDAAFPIFNPDGVIVAVKRRLAKSLKDQRYTYDTPGHGTPSWCSPKFRDSKNVLLVEGELNGAIAHSVILQFKKQNFPVMAMAGGNGLPYAAELAGKNVYVYADGDEAGKKAQQRWAQIAVDNEAESVKLMPPLPKGEDFCSVSHEKGRKGLFKILEKLFTDATSEFGPLDRTIGYYTVREIFDSAKRALSGEILLPTGYEQLDEYTEGLPESGIVCIGALPSMGKSVMLRDILSTHVDRGNTVMLFSPDQSVPSILRLLTNRRSGIPLWRVRKRNYTPQQLEEHGSPEKCTKHWQSVFEDTTLHYSKRFMLSEIQDLKTIKREIERLRDKGVTMFAGDYLQEFEMEADDGTEVEGKAIKDFKEFSRRLKIPFIFAVQLAKYKFGQGRKSGIPLSTDIEGSGKIFQQSEQVFLIYNYHLYTQEFKENEINNPDSEYVSHPQGGVSPMARVYVRKNKEGRRDEYRYAIWDAEVPSFRNAGDDIISAPTRRMVKVDAF